MKGEKFYPIPSIPEGPQRQVLATVEDVMRSQHTCSAPFELLPSARLVERNEREQKARFFPFQIWLLIHVEN